jgi:anti-sigma factor RsiW
MTCNELPEEDLVAWLDGECAPADAARVAAHVAACAVCRREADLLRASGELLSRLPDLAPSSGFEARVVAAVRADGTATAPRGRLVVFRPRVAAAAAAVLVGVTAGAFWLSSGGPPGSEVLTAREEEAIAEDLAVISNLDALENSEAVELAQLADDLDVLDAIGSEAEGG